MTNTKTFKGLRFPPLGGFLKALSLMVSVVSQIKAAQIRRGGLVAAAPPNFKERREPMTEAIMTKETMLLESIGKKLSQDNQSYIVGYAQAVLDMYPPKEKKKRKERK